MVRTIWKVSMFPLALIALACGKEREDSVAADLRQDLELARTASFEFAGNSDREAKVISSLEMGAKVKTRQPASPRPPIRRAHVPAPKAVAQAEASVEESSSAPLSDAATAVPSAPAADESASAPVSRRPRPIPIAYPTGGETATIGRGGGGADIGGVIGGVLAGVVLRGGGVDGDHCERHGTGRARNPRPVIGGIAINQRIPPIGRTTFPRY